VLEGDDPGSRAFAVFLRPHPGAFRKLILCVSTPGNLPIYFKKMLMPGGLAREGGMGTAGID